MRVILEVIEGPLSGRKIAFRSPIVVTVGRTERADYVLERDPQISSLHLQFDCEDDVLSLRDLNSSNGTWVNNQRVDNTQLHDRDRVRIGESILLVSIQGAASNTGRSESSVESESIRPRETATKASAETIVDLRPEPPTAERLTPKPSPTASSTQPLPPVSGVSHGGAPSVLLKIESDTNLGRTIWIRSGQHLTFGRNEQSDVVIADDERLSALHFAVKFDGQICEIQDLDSQNGLSVNGAAVRVDELNDGDEIIAGQTTFQVVRGDHAPRLSEQRRVPKAPASTYLAAVPSQKWPPYRSGLSALDPRVRQEAMLAAVWRRQMWIPDYCRSILGQSPVDWQAAYLFAVLAVGDQTQVLTDWLGSSNDVLRFRVLGALGHPDGMPLILAGIADPDVQQASAAGSAFTKVTALEIDSSNRAPLPADPSTGPGEDVDDEDADLVWVPDLATAQQHWHTVESHYRQGVRWCRGLEISGGAAELDQLDMESRSEALLREHFHGFRDANPSDLARFPLCH